MEGHILWQLRALPTVYWGRTQCYPLSANVCAYAPNYYILVISDRWLHAETCLPISLKHLLVPKNFPKPTPLLDLQALPLSTLHKKEFKAVNANTFQTFNKMQTQVFQARYTSNESVFVSASAGTSGKTICVEFILLWLWSKPEQLRVVCIKPARKWLICGSRGRHRNFKNSKEGRRSVSETSTDLQLLEKGDTIICTPTQVCLNSCPWHWLLDSES